MLHIINLTANGQSLECKSVFTASHLVSEIRCDFTLDESWQGFDYLRAFFEGRYGETYGVIIHDGTAIVPHEVLTEKGSVKVNLCAYSVDGAEVTERMTSFKTIIIDNRQVVNVDGENSAPPTPEEWEQELAEEKRQRQAGDEALEKRIEEVAKQPAVEKLNQYLYSVTYSELTESEPTDSNMGGCSSFVRDRKLHRNLDWDYSEDISFIVNTEEFTGMAFGALSEVDALPYKVVDGVNRHGIMVSTHIIFNDWDWNGDGTVALHKLPFVALTTMESIEDISDLPLDDLHNTPTLAEQGYVAQYLITDGITTYVVMPSETENVYVCEDITDNPKIANFRWVNETQVTRDMESLQLRPTGIERFNAMPCELSEIKFTDCYMAPDRLSEFIGVNDTTKFSTDEELMGIYESARAKYINRTRDRQTWQTMHSVVYGTGGMVHLCIQEDWDNDYIPWNADVKEAPKDGKIYARKDGAWTEISSGGASDWADLENKPFERIGANLKVVNGTLSVDTVTDVVADETRPITSAGVHVVVGNIGSILETI